MSDFFQRMQKVANLNGVAITVALVIFFRWFRTRKVCNLVEFNKTDFYFLRIDLNVKKNPEKIFR